jgi:hypothetical protein
MTFALSAPTASTTPRISDATLVVASSCIWLVTMPLQATIAGRMQLAHLGDIMALALLLPVISRLSFSRVSVAIMATAALYLAITAFFAATRAPYGIFLATFYVVSILHIVAVFEFFRQNPDVLPRTIQILTIATRCLTVLMLVHFVATRNVPYAFLMQDKTYFLCFLNMLILIELLNADLLVHRVTLGATATITALVVLQLPTASRSIILFAPFIMMVALRLLSRGSSPLGRIAFTAAACATAVYIVTHLDQIVQVTRIVDRLLGVLDAQDSSADQHGILVEIAIQEKFRDWATFIFGAGTAGFQIIAQQSERFPELVDVVPDFGIAVFRPDFAYFPGASIWAESFLELPIFLWVPCALFMAFLGIRILFLHRLAYAVFIASLYACGLIYSLHHTSFFFLCLMVLVLLAFCIPSTRQSNAAA